MSRPVCLDYPPDHHDTFPLPNNIDCWGNDVITTPELDTPLFLDNRTYKTMFSDCRYKYLHPSHNNGSLASRNVLAVIQVLRTVHRTDTWPVVLHIYISAPVMPHHPLRFHRRKRIFHRYTNPRFHRPSLPFSEEMDPWSSAHPMGLVMPRVKSQGSQGAQCGDDTPAYHS